MMRCCPHFKTYTPDWGNTGETNVALKSLIGLNQASFLFVSSFFLKRFFFFFL